jgi:hypothetical protein
MSASRALRRPKCSLLLIEKVKEERLKLDLGTMVDFGLNQFHLLPATSSYN